MKVLHLFSNSKWTGPAEPALNLCVALRRIGVDAAFACAPVSKAPFNKVVATARARGIEPIAEFRLNKHRHVFDNRHDVRALNRHLREHRYDLIHCHLTNDHRIAIGPARRADIPIVRSSYEGTGLTPRGPHRKLLQQTAALLEPSRLALEHDAAMYDLPKERLHVVPGAVDTDRFDPSRPLPDGRAALGISPQAFVVGIVARMQTHRRFEDFWEAIRRLVAHGADAHVVVVGRGTNQERVGMEPVRKAGLADRVHFTGFIDEDDYVAALNSFDAKVYLVPGSDGTCRAVREALAMGTPCVVSNRGMLPEIVVDGQTGYVCDGSADALAGRLIALYEDRTRREEMGRSARLYAETHYSLGAQAQQVATIYASILGVN